MRYLIISIYDSAWNFDAQILDTSNHTAVTLEPCYIDNLKECYENNYWDADILIPKAKALNFDGVVLCEDGGIRVTMF